jgi:hypothetical protein
MEQRDVHRRSSGLVGVAYQDAVAPGAPERPVRECLQLRYAEFQTARPRRAEGRELGGAPGGATSFDQNRKVGFETRPAGNAVNLEEEMMKVSANQMDYAAVTSLYGKSLHLLKTAIGKG